MSSAATTSKNESRKASLSRCLSLQKLTRATSRSRATMARFLSVILKFALSKRRSKDVRVSSVESVRVRNAFTLLTLLTLPTIAPGAEWFADITAASGLRFTHVAGTNYFMPDQIGSGVALFDYD